MSQPGRITDLFSIRYPLVQAGMIWCSVLLFVAAFWGAG
jgi:NAD(P)H-dependent flavin oxidoreductase YrpB (nitropropane dioxygenase family)